MSNLMSSILLFFFKSFLAKTPYMAFGLCPICFEVIAHIHPFIFYSYVNMQCEMKPPCTKML